MSETGESSDIMRIPAAYVHDDAQHKHLLRVFTVFSILAVLAILLMVFLSSYRIVRSTILRKAEEDAAHLAHALFQHDLEALIAADYEEEKCLAVAKESLGDLDRLVEDSREILHLAKIKVYSREGRIVYSTDRNIIGKIDTNNDNLRAALQGEPSSKLESKKQVWDLADEQRFAGDMVEAYLPLRNEAGAIVGAFEIYVDVSPYHQSINRIVIISLAAASVVLLCVFTPLIFIMRNATNAIWARSRELKILSGLLPVCSFCKKIRNGGGQWEIMEAYITSRSESQFSHTVCPQCAQEHYPDLFRKNEGEESINRKDP